MICASKTNLETTGNSLLEFHVRTPKIPRHSRSGNTKIDIEDLNTARKREKRVPPPIGRWGGGERS
jgi:hypothetical protein